MKMNLDKAITHAKNKVAKMKVGNKLAMYQVLMQELDNDLYEVYIKKNIFFAMELDNDVEFIISNKGE